jgi:acyl-CoA thioesterase
VTAGTATQGVGALEPLDGSTWRATFTPDWLALGGIHGGLIVAVMLRAAALAADRRPATITAHLHSPVGAGPAKLEVDVIRVGRSAASVRVAARQTKVRASGLVLREGADDPSQAAGPPLLTDDMPETRPQDTAPLEPAPGIRLPMLDQIEIRPTPVIGE